MEWYIRSKWRNKQLAIIVKTKYNDFTSVRLIHREQAEVRKDEIIEGQNTERREN